MILYYIMEKVMIKKDIVIRVPLEMYDNLNELAKRENRPRSNIMREFLQRGIESKREKTNGSK
jgi:predicted DNA-binding protein